MKRYQIIPFALFLSVLLCLGGCAQPGSGNTVTTPGTAAENPGANDSVQEEIDLAGIPEFSGSPYVAVYNNEPDFSEEEKTTTSFEQYGELDQLGRCTAAFANIGQDLMPKEKREGIGQVKPSGWQTVKYDCVDGKYLYNRCHLIGYQLSGENANEKNLITGTRYLNVEGMLPFENMVADYVKETDNHVLYRVTPVFTEDNLVADGVVMEALSVEDQGEGVCFHVFVYNNQPGIAIDYATGGSVCTEDGSETVENTSVQEKETGENEKNGSSVPSSRDYVLNTSTKKFHLPSCSGAKDIKAENKENYTGDRESLTKQGYDPCGRCKP